MVRYERLLPASGSDRRFWIAILALITLSFLNQLLGELRFEFGFPYPSFAGFDAGDRFADTVKYALSYRTISGALLAHPPADKWPQYLENYLYNNPYGGRENLNRDMLTHFHSPPLSTLYYMSLAFAIVKFKDVHPVLWLCFALYLAGMYVSFWLAIPRPQRTRAAALAVCIFSLCCYPALVGFVRGNYLALITSMLIAVFLFAMFVTRRISFAALVCIAAAMNLRPNAGIFLLAIPLVFGLRKSWKPVLAVIALGAVIFCASLLVVNRIEPEYTLSTFLRGLANYKLLYVTEGGGDGGNSSILSFLVGNHALQHSANPLLPAVLAIALLAAGARAARRPGNWRVILPTIAVAVYLAYMGLTRDQGYESIAYLFLLAMVSGWALWALWRSSLRVAIAPFLLTALYCLSSPIFGDYHLLVFMIPLVLACLASDSEDAVPARIVRVVLVTSVLLLVPKNYLWIPRLSDHILSPRLISIQVVLNPLLVMLCVFCVVNLALKVRTLKPNSATDTVVVEASA